MRPKHLVAVATIAVSTLIGADARAGFMLGDASEFAVIYVGKNMQTLSVNNGSGPSNEAINGTLGIGNTGQVSLSDPLTINGNIDFSAANTGQCSHCTTSGNITINGSVNYNFADVTTALTTLSTLSQTLGAEAGTSVTITDGGSVHASSGMLDASGNRVFTVTSEVNTNANNTFTVNGSSTDFVVFNIPSTLGQENFDAAILLMGGITSDHVLFNIFGGNYTTFSGGSKLNLTQNFSGNHTASAGTFLDLNGDFNINNSLLNGRIFAGDSLNSSIVSGGDVVAPSGGGNNQNVPEPASLTLLGGSLIALALIERRRRKSA